MKLFLIFASVFIVGSCSVQKRLHQPGFHVEWKKRYTANNDSEENVKYKSSSKEETIAEQISLTISGLNLSVQENTIELAQLEDKVIESKNIPLNVPKNRDLSNDLKLEEVAFHHSFKILEKEKITNTKELGVFDMLLLIVSLICTVVIAAGICAIIFGQHWAWLVLGIVLIVAALVYLFAYLIILGVGRSVVRDIKNS